MAYSDNFPTQRAVFTLDAANAGRLDPRCSFTRASTGSYFGTAKHLSSENLIKHSEGTAVWGGTATVTYNYTNGPDGVTGTALRLESASGTERYRYSTGGQFVSGTAYTVSCWVKSNTGVAQTFRFMCSTTANQSADLTTHATDWTRVTATITPNTTNIFAGFVFLSANTNDISVWGLQVNTGSDELDYQATTTQIHRAYAPTLQTAASGAARFEHSAIDGQSMGILVESQFQELLTYTEDLTNAAYTKSNLTIGSNAAISPDGTLTADLCTESDDSSGQDHSLIVTSPTLSAATHTLSVFAKSAGRSHVQLQAYMGSIALNCQATYSLTDGSVSGLTNATGSAESLGNGWYRLKMHFTPTGSAVAGLYFRLCSDASTNNYTGNGYSGAIMWGANLTQSSHAYSYLKADAAATTKAADSLSVPTADIGYTGGDFSLVFETPAGTGQGNYPMLFEMGIAGTTTNRLQLYKSSSTASASDRWYAYQNSTGIGYVTGSAGSSKVAISFANSDLAIDTDTGTLFTDTSQVVPLVDQIAIGSNDTFGSNHLNGHVKRVALYNEALSDTNLQALTS